MRQQATVESRITCQWYRKVVNPYVSQSSSNVIIIAMSGAFGGSKYTHVKERREKRLPRFLIPLYAADPMPRPAIDADWV